MAFPFLALATGLGAAANLGGGLISSGGQAAANAANVQMQNQMNQQTLNAQMAAHEQNTAFQEDSQAFSAAMQDESQRYNTSEAEMARRFNSREATDARQWTGNQAQIDREYNTNEAIAARAYASREAELARNFSATEAATARNVQNKFQESMSATQYQRTMADMRAAGLNPILAYQQGGAGNVAGGGQQASASMASGPSASHSTSSGSQASGPSASSSASSAGMSHALGAANLTAPRIINDQDFIGRALGSVVNSALDTMKTLQEVDYSKQRTKQSEAETTHEGVKAIKTDIESGLVSRQIGKTNAETDLITASTTNANLEAAKKIVELKDMGLYGSQFTPNILERIGRLIQGQVEKLPMPRITVTDRPTALPTNPYQRTTP